MTIHDSALSELLAALQTGDGVDLGAGSFFPSLLEARRRIDQALYAVIMEA